MQQTLLTVIDVLYGAAVGASVRFVEMCMRTYVRGEVDEEEDEYQADELLEDVAVAEPQVSFRTVRDILDARVAELAEREVHPVEVVPANSFKEHGDASIHLSADVSTAKAATVPRAQKNTVMYTACVRTNIYQNPTIEFDGKIGEIPYGEMVIVLEPQGRFYRIAWGTFEGWVLREDIADRAGLVYPEFTVGVENSVDHPNTARIRAILSDPFAVGRSEFALQAGEYVLYRLWRKGIRVSWPTTRPRVPGLWHSILKGTPGIHIGVVPKVGAVMEFLIGSDVGHVAYIEAVFPDGAVSISEANYPDSGIYNERTLTREEWLALKPLFIAFN